MSIFLKINNLAMFLVLLISCNVNGAEMKGLYFNGEQYNDDRMFVLFVAKCTTSENDELISTTIHYESAPSNHKWCVATFKNVKRYMAYRVDVFDTEKEAVEYLEKVEPQTPLISLGGDSPINSMSFEEYIIWKKDKKYKDYNYKEMFLPGSKKPEETITKWKK